MAELSDRYINERYLPDKAIDVMDEVGKSARKKRGAMTVARFKIIARLVWTPEQGELEDEIWDNRSGL